MGVLFISSSPYRAESLISSVGLCCVLARVGYHTAVPSAPTTCQDEAFVPQAQGIRKYPKEGMVVPTGFVSSGLVFHRQTGSR